MTTWWDTPSVDAALDPAGAPVLIPGGRAEALRALRHRIEGFVPEWRDLSDEDAGVALAALFGLQLDPILARANRLPEKALVEFLRAAGLTLAPPRSARTIVAFTTEPSATGPVNVPPGTRLASARADGESGTVTWETDESVAAVNGTLAETQLFDGEVPSLVAEGEPFRPFGRAPEAGAALYLGFEVAGDPGRSLSLAVILAPEPMPQPVAIGGTPTRDTPQPVTRWEALTAAGFKPVEVAADTSGGLSRTGILRLTLPAGWTADRPAQLGEGDPLHWLRLRLASGTPPKGREIAALVPNGVAAEAKETVRDVFPVPETSASQVTAKLPRTPVLSGSVVLEVDEGASGGDLFDLPAENAPDAGGTFRRWREVATLAGQRPDARVFTLDPETGTLTFGDDVEGMQPPPGIRTLAVRSFAVTLGAAGNVGVDEVSRLPVGVRGIASATNLVRGAGGADAEAAETAVRKGPALIKARGRAVSAGDVALLAGFAEGADILRAYALSGVDPASAGGARPGTVGVFVLPRRHPQDPPERPPAITSETLAAVARHIAREVGPLGARIVAGAPRFQDVRAEAVLTIAAGRDPAAAGAAVRAALDTHFNPERTAWPLGATIRHADVLQAILAASDAVVAVPFLALAVDGIAHAACEDVALARTGLPWPDRHRFVIDVMEGGA